MSDSQDKQKRSHVRGIVKCAACDDFVRVYVPMALVDLASYGERLPQSVATPICLDCFVDGLYYAVYGEDYLDLMYGDEDPDDDDGTVMA